LIDTLSVNAIFGFPVPANSYQAAIIARSDSSRDYVMICLTGGPISAAAHGTPYDGPLPGRETIIVLILLLALVGSSLLGRRVLTGRI